jgi:NAD-dependent dihydropyrimidine dehydrogenase PreA subunit
MPQITSDKVKKIAVDLGADIVGIASVERFTGAPAGHGPLDLLLEARSVVVMGVRIPDPVVDYGRYHLKMTEMPPEVGARVVSNNFHLLLGHYTMDMILNILAIKLANKLEINWGLTALPTPDTIQTGLGHPPEGAFMGFFSQRHAATRAGLGEFGFSNLVLTERFGPRVRFVSVITGADLEPDPLVSKKICLRNKCGGNEGPRCFRYCTGGAFKLKSDTDVNTIFINPPSCTERALCTRPAGEKPGIGCGFLGTCMSVCPTGKMLGKGS